jgi:hypothetical protein
MLGLDKIPVEGLVLDFVFAKIKVLGITKSWDEN